MSLIHRECATLLTQKQHFVSLRWTYARNSNHRSKRMHGSLTVADSIAVCFHERHAHIHRFISLSWMTKQAREETIFLSNALQRLAVVCLLHTQRPSLPKRRKPSTGTDDQQFKENKTFKSHSQKSVPNRFTEINEAQREVGLFQHLGDR